MDRAIIAWDKLNVKERKLFSIVILVTILLSVVFGINEGNKINAGWHSEYCVKCVRITRGSAVCVNCGTGTTTRFDILIWSVVMTISATFVSVLIYVNFIRSRKSLKNEAYNSDAKFTCPYCSQRVEVPNSLFGQMISCPTCEKDFRASGIAERDGRTVTV
jgi:transcription elongation factor Elf1